jgi:hypothetical protein
MSNQRVPQNPFPYAVKEAFFNMSTEDGYKCKERVHPDKIRRYLSYLDDPSLKPRKDHAQDSKLRFKAFKCFEIIEGKLYRKPEGKCTESLEVIYQNHAFDIISRMHLHLGHPGRDPLFLALDQEVYGMKRSEYYWIKDNCLHCNLSAANNTKDP